MAEKYLIEDYSACTAEEPTPARMIFTDSASVIKLIGETPKDTPIVIYPISSESIIDWRVKPEE